MSCYFILDSLHWLFNVMVEDLALQNVSLFCFLFLLSITKLFRKPLFEYKFAPRKIKNSISKHFWNYWNLYFSSFLTLVIEFFISLLPLKPSANFYVLSTFPEVILISFMGHPNGDVSFVNLHSLPFRATAEHLSSSLHTLCKQRFGEKSGTPAALQS